MVNGENSKRRKLMRMMEVLSQGKKLAKQLQKHLDPNSTPTETREYLIAEILSTYNKAIDVANSQPYDQISFRRSGNATPARSISNSAESSDHLDTSHRRPSKKRKSLPRWVKKVKVESETEQGPLNDGYNWRKYGQKDIHGAAFPRGYYRCSHLPSQGCIATKQIQKSNEDPTIFHVIYRGHHTCTQSSSNQSPPPVPHSIKPDPDPVEARPQQITVTDAAKAPEISEAAAPQSFFFRCFSFSTAPFLETAAEEVANEWFITEASRDTSDSNLLRSSESDAGVGVQRLGVWTPESEFNASATNSPMLDWPGFTLEELDNIDPNFSFDNPEIFS